MNGLRILRISDIAELTSAKCRIKNPAKVEIILNELAKGGFQKLQVDFSIYHYCTLHPTFILQVISDFDHTITKQGQVNGRNVESSFGMLDSCKSLPKNYIEKSKNLYLKYRPMEVDPKVPMDIKINLMVEWWTQSSENLK